MSLIFDEERVNKDSLDDKLKELISAENPSGNEKSNCIARTISLLNSFNETWFSPWKISWSTTLM